MKGPVINGEQYLLVLLRIIDRDDMGRPNKVILGYDDSTFDLKDPTVSNEFITAFIKEDLIKPKTPVQ